MNGVAFGCYYKMEIVQEEAVYRQLFPTSLGYPKMSSNEPVKIRTGDKCPYVKISVGDSLRVRVQEKSEWIKKLKV